MKINDIREQREDQVIQGWAKVIDKPIDEPPLVNAILYSNSNEWDK